VPSDLELAAAHAGSLFMLCLRQFAFPRNAFMRFVCTFDATFELAPIVRELFGHFVDPAWHIATDAGKMVTLSPTWNLCEGIGHMRLPMLPTPMNPTLAKTSSLALRKPLVA
jgi:hypothetical protein